MPNDTTKRYALEDDRILPTDELKKIIKLELSKWLSSDKDADLPMLPHIAAQAVVLMNNPQSSITEVAQLLEQDQVLAAQVIKLANSPFYRSIKDVTTLSRAILVIGLRSVLDLIFSISLQGKVFRHPRYSARMSALWRHSMGAAYICREIAKGINANVDIAFLFGLLHDIGKPLIIDTLTKLSQKNPDQISLKLIDDTLLDEILDEFHCSVGGLIARKWGFPDKLRMAIVYHHDPLADGKVHKGALVTGLADLFCHRFGIGVPPVDRDFSDHPWLQPLGIDFATYLALDEQLRDETQAFLEQFSF
ncbi:MAG: HDOD domain-containing protein [Myxococcales bacterium]|nr:HDOD domain-containing protein [Myxococcales bacterium]